ncbi:MAG: hypothetical protein WCI04_06110 [archaeon]
MPRVNHKKIAESKIDHLFNQGVENHVFEFVWALNLYRGRVRARGGSIRELFRTFRDGQAVADLNHVLTSNGQKPLNEAELRGLLFHKIRQK